MDKTVLIDEFAAIRSLATARTTEDENDCDFLLFSWHISVITFSHIINSKCFHIFVLGTELSFVWNCAAKLDRVRYNIISWIFKSINLNGLNLPILGFTNIVIETTCFIWGKVKYNIPLVLFDKEAGGFAMFREFWVSNIVRIERNIFRALNNWIVLYIQEHFAIVKVSASELSASHMYCTVLAVT